MANASRDTTDKVWKVSADLGQLTSSNVSKTVKLSTAGTYVDEDIWVTATAQAPDAAELGASGTGAATISTATVGTKASNKYPITGSATISGTATATTTTSGFAEAGVTEATGAVSGTASLNATLPAAAASVTLSGTAATPTVAIDAANDNILASAAVTSKPSSGYYAAVKATAPATTLTVDKSVDTAGYLGSDAEITASGSTTAKSSGDYYIPITAGSIGVSDSAAPTGYTENTTAVVPTAGSLTLDEGYYPKTYIKLSTLVPDEATITNDVAGAATIRTGTTAYDKNGALITGTMGDASVKSGNITATAVAPSYNSTNKNFDVAVTASAAAPTVSTNGYISTTEGTKTANSTVTSSATLAKVALQATKTSGDLTKAPTLVRTAKPSGDTWTDAANGAATTTKPTTGAYIQIDAAAATGQLKIKPSVKTAGYGDTTNYDFTEYTATVGAAAATTAYVPVKGGSRGALTNDVSATGNITLGTASETQPSGYYIKASGTATEAAGTTGWTSHATRNASDDTYYAINAAALTHSNTATETKVAVEVSGTRSTNLAAPGSDTTYYVTINGAQTAAGSVVHSASVSEGYVPTAGLSTDATIPTSASVSGNGDKVYLKSTKITGSMNANITSGYTLATLATTAPTAPYITLTGNGAATSGAVYNGTATAANKYMPVYAGAYTIV